MKMTLSVSWLESWLLSTVMATRNSEKSRAPSPSVSNQLNNVCEESAALFRQCERLVGDEREAVLFDFHQLAELLVSNRTILSCRLVAIEKRFQLPTSHTLS